MRVDALGIPDLAGPLGWTLLHSFWQGLLVWTVLRFAVGRIPRPDIRARLGLLGLAVFLGLQLITFAACLHGAAAAWSRGASLLIGPRGTFVPTDSPDEGWFGSAIRHVDPLMPWLVVGWTLWTIYRVAACARDVRRTQRLLDLADPLPEPLLGRLQRLASRVGVRPGSIRFVTASLTVGPGTIGWLRPFIFMPPELLLTMSPAQIEAVVAHELAHVLRHDYLLAAIQFAIEGVYTCNPFVRWIVAQLNDDAERACDRIALRHVADRGLYARALHCVAAESVQVDRLVRSATGGAFSARVVAILYPPASERSASAWTALGLTASLVAALLAISTSTLASASAARNEAKFLSERTLGQAVDDILNYDGDVPAVRAAVATSLGHAIPDDVDRSITLLADATHASSPPQFRSAYATVDEVVARSKDHAGAARIERFLLHALGADGREFSSLRLSSRLGHPDTYSTLGVSPADVRRLFNAQRYENDRRVRSVSAMKDLDAFLRSETIRSQTLLDLALQPEVQIVCATLARGQNRETAVAHLTAFVSDSHDQRLNTFLNELRSPTVFIGGFVTLPPSAVIVNHGEVAWSKTQDQR